MGNTQERIRKRQQYLKKKGGAYAKLALSSFLIVPCFLFALCSSLLLVPGALFLLLFGDTEGNLLERLVGPVVLFGELVEKHAHSAVEAHKEAKQLAYVPPVTVQTLPAEEVLLRGSEEPMQGHSKVLLRGTQSGQENVEQQLLRSSQGREQKP